MKKNIFILIFALFVISSLSGFAGCKQMENYRAYIPNDQPYYAELNYKSKGETYDWEYNFAVTQTQAEIAGENRDVIYIEYKLDDNFDTDNYDYDAEYTLLYVNKKSFYLEDSQWKKDVSSLWTRWSKVYGSMSNSGTFVDFMVNKVWDRDFPKSSKKTTDEYIEYTFKYDEEVFRLANNPYHYILYYHLKTDALEITQNATVQFGTPTTTIPNLNTLTLDMIMD